MIRKVMEAPDVTPLAIRVAVMTASLPMLCQWIIGMPVMLTGHAIYKELAPHRLPGGKTLMRDLSELVGEAICNFCDLQMPLKSVIKYQFPIGALTAMLAGEVFNLDAVSRLGKQVRIHAVDPVTGEVYTARNAYDTPEWWAKAPNAMLGALKAKFYGNEELTNRLLETSPRPLARAAKYDRRWGIGCTCTLEEAQWGIEWNGPKWLGKALVELRNTLEAERIIPLYIQAIS